MYGIVAVHDVGHGTFCKVCQGVNCGNLHFLVNGCGRCVERTAKEIGETKHVVYLIGIVASSGGYETVGTGFLGIFVGNLGHGIGKRKDYGLFRHGLDHFL